jgi:hypothetical protein
LTQNPLCATLQQAVTIKDNMTAMYYFAFIAVWGWVVCWLILFREILHKRITRETQWNQLTGLQFSAVAGVLWGCLGIIIMSAVVILDSIT